ncbi:MAG: hypothetical protein ABIR96_01945 [Bdellovibrionota bacterium]
MHSHRDMRYKFLLIISGVFFLLAAGAAIDKRNVLALAAIGLSESSLYIYLVLAVLSAWLGYHTKKKSERTQLS